MSQKAQSALLRLAAIGAAAALTLTGCSGGSSASDPEAGTGGEELQKVTLALDWTANTNHLGIFAAQELGYFADAGVELELVPYASAPATDLITSGTADFGITQQSSVQSARTAGQEIKGVFALVQHETGGLATLSSRDDLQRPADLEGKIFGGFGSPQTAAIVRTVIQNDGGTGEFQDVTLNTAAYDALSSGDIDFTSTIQTWENVRQELTGDPYRVFNYGDFGIPDQHTLVIASSDSYLDENPELASAFLGALQQGYAYAAENPEEAAQILLDTNPDVLTGADELVKASANLLSEGGFFVAEDGVAGWNNPEFWSGLGDFLIENELLSDASGTPVTEAPDWEEFYTNEFLTD